MPTFQSLLIFAALSLGLAATPGPNMLYIVTRSLAQGTRAGMVSLIGCQVGSLVLMVLAALGITAALFAVPYAYDSLRLGGAAYLAFLAWQSVKPGGRDMFAPTPLPPEPPPKLFAVGFVTSALNPKIALFYIAVLPPFIDPTGDVLAQGLILGATQIIVCTGFDALLVWGSGGVSRFLSARPFWLAAQRWVLGAALALLAIKLATTSRA
jgi:threonine/homoserine/homoserine lactone efflux protein